MFYEKTKRLLQWLVDFGLSYASFTLQQLSLQLSGTGLDADILVNVAVCNNSTTTGGMEVIQAYASCITHSTVGRPVKELKDFTKLYVPASEMRQASIEILLKYAVRVWDDTADSWLMESGTYRLSVGNSNDSVPLSTQFEVLVSEHWRGL